MNVQFVCVNRDNLMLISNSAMHMPSHSSSNQDTSAQKRRSGGDMKRNIAARLLAEAKAKHNQFRNGNTSQQSVINEWTLYNLEVPKVDTVIEDLEMLAETFRTSSSSNFYDLMEEAHVMLRLSLSLEFARLSHEQEQKLRAKFIENCHKLADFSIRSKKKEVYLQATGFYKMCNLQLPDIYSNFISNFLTTKEDEYNTRECSGFQGDVEHLVGLIYTVKLFLINLGTDRQKASFLHQLVKPFFSRKQMHDQPQQRSQHVPLALEFLNMFILCSPADIPQIMLTSPIVADIVSADLIVYLNSLEKRSPEENLLLAFSACRMSNYILSQEVVSKTSRHNLSTALIKHKNVLFDDGTRLFHRQHREHNALPKSMGSRRYTSQPTRRNQRKSSAAACFQATASFSDFTETILLATENNELIEAISDACIHALCIEHSVSLEMILQLFLNYIATHIGHKGYQSSQKVFVNVLQVYYYDIFDVNPLNNSDMLSTTPPPNVEDDDEDEPSSNAISLNGVERDNESISNSIAESNSGASSSMEERSGLRANRIVFDQQQDEEQQHQIKRNSNASLIEQGIDNFTANESETNLKGLKILFRMYLGRLKALSDLMTDLEDADIKQPPKSEEFLNLRLECIRFLARHMQELKMQQQQRLRVTGNVSGNCRNYYYSKVANTNNINNNNHCYKNNNSNDKKVIFVPFIPDYKMSATDFEHVLTNYIRPIPCLVDRPQYLNRLPPFKRSDFSYPDKEDGIGEVHFVGWHNEMLTLALKIQSLLSSTKIDREIVEEFVSFIQKTPNLLGIDSFLVIILPKNLAINYMLNFCPEFMWQYGKSNNFTPKHWESLLKKILSKQEILPNWKTHATDILNNLVAELTFEELLQCFPSEVISNRNTEAILRNADNRCIYEPDEQLLDEQKTKINDKYPPRNHLAMDNIDENNVFEVVLRKAVSKQRSLALRSMIESTGTQLFDATSNPMYNLN